MDSPTLWEPQSTLTTPLVWSNIPCSGIGQTLIVILEAKVLQTWHRNEYPGTSAVAGYLAAYYPMFYTTITRTANLMKCMTQLFEPYS
jgi:hypothetical protein